jgi:hypothetical protein
VNTVKFSDGLLRLGQGYFPFLSLCNIKFLAIGRFVFPL